MKFTLVKGLNKTELKKIDAVIVPVWMTANKPALPGGVFAALATADRNLLNGFMKARELKAGEVQLIKLAGNGFAFIASENAWTEKKFALLIRKVIRRAKQEGFKKIGVYLDDFERDKIFAPKAAEIITTNALMAHYDFSEEFKSKPKGGWKRIESVTIFTLADMKPVAGAIKAAEIIGEEVNRSRTLSNFPPGDMKPEGLVEAAKTIAGETPSIVVTVFDEKRLKAEGMNGILAVGQGSIAPPRLIIMEYKGLPLGRSDAGLAEPRSGFSGAKVSDVRPIALVGKGVTFDSGGLNIKPGESMADMHMDMSGGAAVLSAISAIARLKLPVNVIALVPAVENMPSGLSYRQGDIIKAYGGKTMEIGNTDAEGRVILADAIEYAKTKKPALIVTLATLTGAAMGALGLRSSALFVKNNRPLQDEMQNLGDTSGDAIWPLPLLDESDSDIVGNFADVTNTHKNNSRYGGAITGASFLWAFAKPANFAHIDMAPRMTTIPEDELARGSAGYGVRYFVELALQWEKVQKLLK